MRSNTIRRLLATGIVVMLGMAVNPTASASPVQHATVVSEDPANYTPDVITGTAVYKMLQVGTTMFAGGDFTQVRDSDDVTHNRAHLFSFDAATGAVTPLSVSFDRAVWGLASDGTSLWVGGNFRTVNGLARRGLVKMSLAGVVDPAFNARLKGNVADVQLVDGRLIVGGKFAKKLQAVDPTTGADTGYLDLNISGTVADNAGATDIYRFAVDHASNATRLVAIGNFTSVSGVTRYRAFMVNLGPASGTLASWYYTPLSLACRATRLPAQLRDVDFSPDGSFFVIVATGFIPQSGHQGITICDATARFDAAVPNPFRPVWMNYTGGDTLHSVVVTDAAVYIQGHQRWVSSTGVGCTPGCAEREGIAALHPDDGDHLSWNPGKERGVGGKDLLLTPAGLWVASDTNLIAGESRDRLAFLPLPPP